MQLPLESAVRYLFDECVGPLSFLQKSSVPPLLHGFFVFLLFVSGSKLQRPRVGSVSHFHCLLCEFKHKAFLGHRFLICKIRQLLWRKREARHKLAPWPEEMVAVLTSPFRSTRLLFKWLLGRNSLSHSLSFPLLSFPNFVLLHLPLEELQPSSSWNLPTLSLLLNKLRSSSYLLATFSCLSSCFRSIFLFAFPSSQPELYLCCLYCLKFPPPPPPPLSVTDDFPPCPTETAWAVSSLLTCLSHALVTLFSPACTLPLSL